jgi:hypothetical protein
MKEMEEEIRVQYYAQDTNCVELLELRTELAQQNDSLARINDSMYLHAMQRMVSANAQLLMDKNELVSMLENRERVLDSLAHNKGLMSTDSFTRDSLSVGCTGYFVAGNNDSGCAVFKNGSNKSITIKFVSDDLATAIILLYILREESPGLKLIRL